MMPATNPIRDLQHIQAAHQMDNAYIELGSALSDLLIRHGQQRDPRRASGLSQLDEFTDGLAPGELLVLASRPSMGRGPILTRMIDAIAIEQRLPVLIFCSDFGVDQYCHFGIGSQFPGFGALGRIGSSGLQEKYRRYLSFLVEKYKDAPIALDNRIGLSVKEMREQAEVVRNRMGQIGLIVVGNSDALNLRKYGSSRYDQLVGLSKALKKLARQHGCAVLIESEVNRRLERRKRKNMRPKVKDLCCQGALGTHADKLLFVYNHQVYFPDADPMREIIIGKNRTGPTGSVVINEEQIFNPADQHESHFG